MNLAILALFAGGLMAGSGSAQAGGYYYRARSFYVTPPIYANLPIFGQPPIVVYEPVVTYPAPVAGYYTPISTPVIEQTAVVAPAPIVAPAPVAVPTGRVRERQLSTPLRTRYDYKVDYPNGVEYRYRYRRLGGVVRFSERWDD
jgi:hypothetical protein